MTNGACWAPLARSLEEDYDVIMPDAQGHGNSSIPDHGYNYKYLAADVIGFIDTLKLDSPFLLGHSMGGMTAAMVASHNPKRLRGVVLADPTFLSPQRQREVYESDVVGQHRRVLNRPKEELLAEMWARPTRRSSEIMELLIQARCQTNIRALEVLTPPNPDYRALVKLLDLPILLVTGDVGSVVSPEMAAELALLNKKLETVQIREAGHGIPYDQPDRFSAVVQTFLRSVSGSLSPIKMVDS